MIRFQEHCLFTSAQWLLFGGIFFSRENPIISIMEIIFNWKIYPKHLAMKFPEIQTFNGKIIKFKSILLPCAKTTEKLLPHFLMLLSSRTAERNPILWNLSAVCAHGEMSNYNFCIPHSFTCSWCAVGNCIFVLIFRWIYRIYNVFQSKSCRKLNLVLNHGQFN